jgi:5,10-methylenetetrahydromethanopterin reductase
VSAPRDLRIGCTITPSPKAPELARLAEDLGYAQLWVNDSPALYPDVWVTLAQIAESTRHVPIGPAVLVPGLRHPLVTASAIATLERIAPGRVAAVVGSGFTGRLAVGMRPATWKEIRRYVVDVKTLLAGETLESDMGVFGMIHPDGYVAERPLSTPILIAAIGPKGLEVAREIGDGVVSLRVGQPGFERCAVSINGTVLRPGETLADDRVSVAAGPGIAVSYHVAYALRGLEAVCAMPNGREWAQQYEALPPERRQMALHEGHHAGVTGLDRMLVTSDALRSSSFTGEPEDLRERLRRLRDGGATEITYHPSSDVAAEELEAFAAMADVRDGVAQL